jgi:hypothetical protein
MLIAFDKQSARTVDANGYLHVSLTNISKATVNPYYGHEIPGCESLGLDPKKVYKLLRAPEELKAGASTFNNLPILDVHIPVSAFDLDKPEIKKHVVGSTGTDAEYDAPYLKNSMVLHTASAISDVEEKKKAELSCAYRYAPVMNPGVFEGEHYDGVMTKLEGNHVALVTEGRAGHDVKVMDSKIGGAKVVDYRKVREAMGNGPTEKIRSIFFAKDSNPDGVNQYSVASGKAKEATKYSVASGKAKEATKNAAKLEKKGVGKADIQNAHLNAWTEHTRAAKLAPTPEKKSAHESAAREHNAGYIKHGTPQKTSLGKIAPWHDSKPAGLDGSITTKARK